ncbi:hypothetical protein H3146_14920 [Streptomyces sp. OF3]|uniref:Lipoprotein n=1 Tax=Streptomyces alkaliterrae TaxID=2213162 RepID=A0A7W3WLP7_9ACTN|nr:hypothetical protein [Streptomyces alkaliterrae]MBB1254644.1 hypothetical protein [Streptomyces alkaliterrae]
MVYVSRRAAVAVATAATATLLLAGAATATASGDKVPGAAAVAAADKAPADTTRAGKAPAGSGDMSVRGGLEVRIVEPYEPLEINEETRLGLLPQGRQNYVVSHPDSFTANVEYAKGLVGDDIRPRSMSLGVQSENGEVTLITGAWRLSEAPREITVRFKGDNFGYAAQIVQLPGKPGWGTYYFDPKAWGLSKKEFTVEGVDRNGRVFDTVEHKPW